MKQAIKHELKIQSKINNLVKYMAIFFVFCTFSASLASAREDLQNFGIVFSVISIPLAFIGISASIIKNDLWDGSLELALTCSSALGIIMAKYLSFCICALLSFSFTLPLIYILYNTNEILLSAIITSGFVLIALGAALTILISSVQGYFRTNTNFLAIMIMPLIIPNIILSGLLIQAPDEVHLAFIMVGIDLILIPPCIYLSGYLIENIYNVN